MKSVKPTVKAAIAAIERHGILLVYPIDNRAEPVSLWSVFFPKSEMRWEWDSDGDDRVGLLWRLREQLSSSGKVVYVKWFRGRATFISLGVFADLLAVLGSRRIDRRALRAEAALILETLESDSPLSTKQIKLMTDLRGKLHEPAYEKAMKQLWQRLLIVGFGEVADGAFPSLSVGASQHLFEDAWNQAEELDSEQSLENLRKKLSEDSLFWQFLVKTRAQIQKN